MSSSIDDFLADTADDADAPAASNEAGGGAVAAAPGTNASGDEFEVKDVADSDGIAGAKPAPPVTAGDGAAAVLPSTGGDAAVVTAVPPGSHTRNASVASSSGGVSAVSGLNPSGVVGGTAASGGGGSGSGSGGSDTASTTDSTAAVSGLSPQSLSTTIGASPAAPVTTIHHSRGNSATSAAAAAAGAGTGIPPDSPSSAGVVVAALTAPGTNGSGGSSAGAGAWSVTSPATATATGVAASRKTSGANAVAGAVAGAGAASASTHTATVNEQFDGVLSAIDTLQLSVQSVKHARESAEVMGDFEHKQLCSTVQRSVNALLHEQTAIAHARTQKQLQCDTLRAKVTAEHDKATALKTQLDALRERKALLTARAEHRKGFKKNPTFPFILRPSKANSLDISLLKQRQAESKAAKTQHQLVMAQQQLMVAQHTAASKAAASSGPSDAKTQYHALQLQYTSGAGPGGGGASAPQVPSSSSATSSASSSSASALSAGGSSSAAKRRVVPSTLNLWNLTGDGKPKKSYLLTHHTGTKAGPAAVGSTAAQAALVGPSSTVANAQYYIHLPANVIVHMFSYCGVRDVDSSSSVCRAWRIVLTRTKVWRTAMARVSGIEMRMKQWLADVARAKGEGERGVNAAGNAMVNRQRSMSNVNADSPVSALPAFNAAGKPIAVMTPAAATSTAQGSSTHLHHTLTIEVTANDGYVVSVNAERVPNRDCEAQLSSGTGASVSMSPAAAAAAGASKAALVMSSPPPARPGAAQGGRPPMSPPPSAAGAAGGAAGPSSPPPQPVTLPGTGTSSVDKKKKTVVVSICDILSGPGRGSVMERERVFCHSLIETHVASVQQQLERARLLAAMDDDEALKRSLKQELAQCNALLQSIRSKTDDVKQQFQSDEITKQFLIEQLTDVEKRGAVASASHAQSKAKITKLLDEKKEELRVLEEAERNRASQSPSVVAGAEPLLQLRGHKQVLAKELKTLQIALDKMRLELSDKEQEAVKWQAMVRASGGTSGSGTIASHAAAPTPR